MEEDWLTEEQLLARASTAGFHPPELTPRKIERWRKARLLPHPRLTPLGRGQGMRSEYPPETDKQLLALCQHRRRFPHDLDAIRFALWYDRYPLSLDDVKQSIEQLTQPFQRGFAALASDASDPLAAAEQIAQQMQPKLGRSKVGRRLQHIGDEDDVNAVLTAMLQLWLGGIPGFTAHTDKELGERSLADLFIDALGMKRGQTDRFGGADPWLPQNVEEIGRQLESLAGEQLLSMPALLQTLKEATVQQLAQARTDLARMFTFKTMVKAMEALVGADAFGYGSFRELPSDPSFLAWFLLVLLRLRPTHNTGLSEVGTALQNGKPVFQRMLAFFKTLRKEYPAIAEEIFSQTQHLNLRDPQAAERLHEIFVMARGAHPEELDAFFQKHPELSASEEGA